MANKQQDTPMMRQFHSVKAQHPGMLLFFRMGDFYEMFEQDAVEASRILNLTLTSRNGIPMCGVPHHAAANYLERLLKAGQKVAVCDQIEDPALAKGIVKRAVTRVITPGTLMDDRLLAGNANNNLLAVFSGKNGTALAVADVSTGEFWYAESDTSGAVSFIEEELVRYAPRECLLLEGAGDTIPESVFEKIPLTRVPGWAGDPALAGELLREHFGVHSLDGFGLEEGSPGVAAAGMVLHYLKETQKSSLANITRLVRVEETHFVALPRATQLNLELVRNLSGGDDATLFSVLDRTKTPAGGRLLRQSILKPLRDAGEIEKRLDLVTVFVTDRVFLGQTGEALSGIRDLQRLISRIAGGRANARDLVALRFSLEGVHQLRRHLLGKPEFLEIRLRCADFSELTGLLAAALLDEPALTTGEGGMVRDGWDKELDALRDLSKDSRDWIAELQAAEQKRTGIASLKVKYNRVVGYFIEVSKANSALVPADYERKQTLVGGERYIIPSLKEYEEKVLTARERIIALEEKIFQEIREKAAGWLPQVMEAAEAVALVDMLACFATLALERDYVRPQVHTRDELLIREGRHPVVECALDGPFVPNDTDLDLEEKRIMIVTGPNMAGKSTYLRQTALIVLMAQIGSYVPAASASIGIVDRIYTRVGASDNLARGQSTFLVEMLETAAILNSAGARSLLIMDEIGRGTSTYDGLAIAWSIIEFLHQNPERGGRTLFATHYHELTVLGEEHGIGNLNVEVREWNDQVIFLKKVVPGSADKSYGIHVARLAGLPAAVIMRARQILRELEEKTRELDEEHHRRQGGTGEALQLPLFKPYEQEVLARIRELDPDYLTPMEAHLLLAEFKEKL